VIVGPFKATVKVMYTKRLKDEVFYLIKIVSGVLPKHLKPQPDGNIWVCEWELQKEFDMKLNGTQERAYSLALEAV
jgi:hypothetical protein